MFVTVSTIQRSVMQHTSLLGPSIVKKMKSCEYGPCSQSNEEKILFSLFESLPTLPMSVSGAVFATGAPLKGRLQQQVLRSRVGSGLTTYKHLTRVEMPQGTNKIAY